MVIDIWKFIDSLPHKIYKFTFIFFYYPHYKRGYNIAERYTNEACKGKEVTKACQRFFLLFRDWIFLSYLSVILSFLIVGFYSYQRVIQPRPDDETAVRLSYRLILFPMPSPYIFHSLYFAAQL